MLLPAFVALFGVAAALCMLGLAGWLAAEYRRRTGQSGRQPARSPVRAPDLTERIPVAHRADYANDEDDDAYVEFTLTREPHAGEPFVRRPAARPGYDPEIRLARRSAHPATEPLNSQGTHPADTRRRGPARSADNVFEGITHTPNGETLGIADNGTRADSDQWLRSVARFAPFAAESTSAGAAELDGDDRRPSAARNGGQDIGAAESQLWPVDDRSFEELSFEELWSGRARPRTAEGGAPRDRRGWADPDGSGGSGRHSSPE